MALYTIADLHLSLGVGKEKSMEVFGRRWQGYTEKLEHNWRAIIEPEDDVVIPGDISWALGIDAALEDLRFIDSLPGTKYIGKGNHDFWWSTRKKLEDFFAAHGITSIRILYNCAYEVEDYIICGTRGWFYEEDAAGTHTGKMLAREALRLEASLKAAEGKPIYCFLHYPPIYQGYKCPEMLELLDKYEVERCYYGHLHGYTHRRAFEGMREKTEYALIAADYVAFQPVKICN